MVFLCMILDMKVKEIPRAAESSGEYAERQSSVHQMRFSSRIGKIRRTPYKEFGFLKTDRRDFASFISETVCATECIKIKLDNFISGNT
jgi:hypothetical protein